MSWSLCTLAPNHISPAGQDTTRPSPAQRWRIRDCNGDRFRGRMIHDQTAVPTFFFFPFQFPTSPAYGLGRTVYSIIMRSHSTDLYSIQTKWHASTEYSIINDTPDSSQPLECGSRDTGIAFQPLVRFQTWIPDPDALRSWQQVNCGEFGECWLALATQHASFEQSQIGTSDHVLLSPCRCPGAGHTGQASHTYDLYIHRPALPCLALPEAITRTTLCTPCNPSMCTCTIFVTYIYPDNLYLHTSAPP